MEHWFDRLSQPHTRRATIKAGVLAGAALVLPVGRLSSAAAAAPCFNACQQESVSQWQTDLDACAQAFDRGQAIAYANLFGGLGPAAVLSGLSSWKAVNCSAKAQTNWHMNSLSCSEPQCGNPQKYPGGNPPGQVPVCTDPGYVPCGPSARDCCGPPDLAECCSCKKGPVCCKLSANCSCCGSSG